MDTEPKPQKNVCSNNCEFAKRSQLLGYTARHGDEFINGEYLWRCGIIDQIITTDASILRLGCASYKPKSSLIDPPPKVEDQCKVIQPSPLAEIVQVASAIEKLEDQIAAIGTAAAAPSVESVEPPVYTGQLPTSGTPTSFGTSFDPGDVPITKVIVVTPEKTVEVLPEVKERKKPGRKPKDIPTEQGMTENGKL